MRVLLTSLLRLIGRGPGRRGMRGTSPRVESGLLERPARCHGCGRDTGAYRLPTGSIVVYCDACTHWRLLRLEEQHRAARRMRVIGTER